MKIKQNLFYVEDALQAEKEAKKAPTKSLKEKRAEKKEKKAKS